MSQVTVLYYDVENTPIKEVQAAADNIRKALPDSTIIAVPKDYDVLLNCSIDQLVNVRALIDTAIQVKIAEESDNSGTQSLDLMNIGAKLPPS